MLIRLDRASEIDRAFIEDLSHLSRDHLGTKTGIIRCGERYTEKIWDPPDEKPNHYSGDYKS